MDAMDGQFELEPVVISLPSPIDVPSSSGSHEHAPLAELASESDSLPQATSKMHEEENEHHMCRVCRSDEGNLYYPCLCTGSIKYVHQECLLEWLKYSKKEVCELCNYKYSFQPIYRPDMPKALPVVEIIKGIAVSALRIVKMWLLYTIVIIAWLGIVPLTAARIYQAVFSANIQNVIYLPLHIFTTEHLATDCAKGMFLLAIFICMFISLVWLREQIIHGGPQEWLQLDDIEDAEEAQQAEHEPPVEEAPLAPIFRHANYVPEVPPNVDAENRPAAPEPFPDAEEVTEPSGGLQRNTSGVPLVFGGQGSASGTGDQDAEDFWTRPPPVVMIEAPEGIELETDDSSSSSDEETDDGEGEEEGGQEEQEEADNDAAPAAEDNWRDWDRLGDELTLARLVGLDGSLAFLEHVFWVISLNTLFTVLFAFSPFKLGSWILTTTGVRGKIVFFPSLACILTGYFAVSVIVFVLHRVCGLLRIKSLYRLLGIVFLVLKVFLLVLMEIGFFPIMCGWWMDLCSLPLFSATLSSRISSFSASPTSSLFLHWMIGMIYVFYSASFVLLLREVLRPGVLWFMRNLNDPEFNPIMEMIELPVARHLRRLVASTSLFFMAILLIVYLPLRVIQKVLPSILPYNMSLSAETPLSELSLELLILQVVLPALLEQTSARTLLKKAVKAWCIIVGRLLKLDRYLLSDNDNNRQNHGNAAAGAEQQPRPRIQQADDGAEPGADGIVGGGLAAEHQALLLLREPIVFEPYTRPSLFPLRILALLGLLSLSATLSSCVCFVVPVSIGRAFIHAMTGHSNVHELYTTGAGLYICWLVAKIITISCEWLNRGGAHLWSMFKNSLNLALHLLLAVLPVVFIIPFLIGVCFQLVVVSPLRVGLQQTPLFFPWQEWAMGVLHMKIFVAGVMMGPEWWMKQAFEQVYQDGVHGLRVGFIYRDIVLPVLVALSMQIATPYAIANIVLSVWSPSLEERVVLLRFCYPFILCIVGLVGFAIWQVNKLRTLAQNIRNEKYLVGTQLVNYERKEEERKIREKEEAEEEEKTRVRVEEENAERLAEEERVGEAEREEGVEDAEIERMEEEDPGRRVVVEQDV